MVLLSEEQYVMKLLSQYGALPKTQVVRLLHQKQPATAERIIRNLVRSQFISELNGYYLGVDSLCRPEQRMITAIWVLLKFIDQVEPMAHYPASYPAQLFFLKEQLGYEIVVLYEGEGHLLKLLRPEDDMKYIIVLPHVEFARTLRLPAAPCLFSTVEHNGQDEPEVTFYQLNGGKTHDGSL